MKIYLHHQNNRSAKKKTHIKKRSLNPVFNESFIFDLPTKDGSLNEVQLEVHSNINQINKTRKLFHFQVIMCDWDRITKNEVSVWYFGSLNTLDDVLFGFSGTFKSVCTVSKNIYQILLQDNIHLQTFYTEKGVFVIHSVSEN